MWSSVIQGCELQKYTCVYNFKGEKEKKNLTAEEDINAVGQDLRAEVYEKALNIGSEYKKEVDGENETVRSCFNL